MEGIRNPTNGTKYIGHVSREHQHHSRARSPMEAPSAPAEPNAVKAKKEDKEFTYERVADDEATLEEEEKMEQGDVKVRTHAPHTPCACCRCV